MKIEVVKDSLDNDWLMDLVESSKNLKSTEDLLLEEYNRRYKTNKKTIPTKKCNRCSGHGRIAQYSHKRGGVCFKCNGSGKN